MKKSSMAKFIISQYDFLKDYKINITEANNMNQQAMIKTVLSQKIIELRYRNKIMSYDKNKFKGMNHLSKDIIRYLISMNLFSEDNYFIFVLLHEIGHAKLNIDLYESYKIQSKARGEANRTQLNILSSYVDFPKKKKNYLLHQLEYQCGFLEVCATNFAYKEFIRIHKLVEDMKNNKLKYKLWEKNYLFKNITIENQTINIIYLIDKNSGDKICKFNENYTSQNNLNFKFHNTNIKKFIRNIDEEIKETFVDTILDLNSVINRFYYIKDIEFAGSINYEIKKYIDNRINILKDKFDLVQKEK